MNRKLILLLILSLPLIAIAQSKKPLDHSVYDAWQSIGERAISNDGNWVVYAVNPQEGDGEIIVMKADGSNKTTIARGYNAIITEDNRFLICRIRAPFKDTRQARIKKKRPDEMPKDSLAILELGKTEVKKFARVKAYKTPEKAGGWVAWHLEKEMPAADSAKAKRPAFNANAHLDSMRRVIDSLSRILNKKKKDAVAPTTADGRQATGVGETEIETKAEIEMEVEILDLNASSVSRYPLSAIYTDAEGDDPAASAQPEGTDLVLYNLSTGEQRTYKFISEFFFNKTGKKLLLEATANKKDSASKPTVFWLDLGTMKESILLKGFNDARNYALDEEGTQAAFVAERDSSSKALQKFYKLWHYAQGADSARTIVHKSSSGMKANWGISEHAPLNFSKSGKRLFFGTAPLLPPKDTTLIEIDLVKLDVWHYNDDYLQPMQLKNLDQELKRSYAALFNTDSGNWLQLADDKMPVVMTTGEGDGQQFLGRSDVGKRVALQWEGDTNEDIYAVNAATGERKTVVSNFDGIAMPSPDGGFILLYDNKKKQYSTWQNGITRDISSKVKVPLADEENDEPDDPSAYGIAAWQEGEQKVYVYDRYDIWQLDPLGVAAPVRVTDGRSKKITHRYIRTNPEERFLKDEQPILVRLFNETDKSAGLAKMFAIGNSLTEAKLTWPAALGFQVQRAKNAEAFIYTKETYQQSPTLYLSNDLRQERSLSSINPQQSAYNWGTAELYKWKTFSGKPNEGILYKPEDFDSTKKYPVLVYFYDRSSNTLHQYQAPAPTPSRLNISFFVSRGYVVLVPDIRYTNGHPGKSAYDYIVSGARALSKYKWIDSTRMGIQGQSWGGYQVCYLITATNLFRAAWAGAPVGNMTSAYGGIRWESGMNRQFQYEKAQSRIGGTLWEKPKEYIENSPLFHLPKVTTPLVIMHNDNDGAVPWYQGIELFTAMRRLKKQVWMLNYNGEAHNLLERKNRKDIQIREQQFFDWLLKGEKPAQWITNGVPAVEKGRNWGLEVKN